MGLFLNAKTQLLRGQIDFLNANLRVLFISGSTYDPSGTQQVLAAIPNSVRVADYPLANTDLVQGADPRDLLFVADDLLIPELSGLPITQVIIYNQSVSEALSQLIWERKASYIPDGADLNVDWGSSIFNLAGKTGNDYYWSGKKAIFSGQVDLDNDQLRVVLTDSGYIPNSIAHTKLGDIPPVNRVGTAEEVLSTRIDDGVFDADDVIYTSLAGDPIVTVVLVKYNTATPDDSELLAYFTEGMNLPFTPDGSLTGVIWNNSPQKILCL